MIWRKEKRKKKKVIENKVYMKRFTTVIKLLKGEPGSEPGHSSVPADGLCPLAASLWRQTTFTL